MTTPQHSEQTLRPVSEVIQNVLNAVQVGEMQEAVDILTTDRDAAYTMLRTTVKRKRQKRGEADMFTNKTMSINDCVDNYNLALDDILTLLDTIYGKTHTS